MNARFLKKVDKIQVKLDLYQANPCGFSFSKTRNFKENNFHKCQKILSAAVSKKNMGCAVLIMVNFSRLNISPTDDTFPYQLDDIIFQHFGSKFISESFLLSLFNRFEHQKEIKL